MDTQDNSGNTPLHTAIRLGNMDIVEMLINSGVNPTLKDQYGMTPLNLACARGELEIVKLLLPKVKEAEEKAKKKLALHRLVSKNI